MAYACYNPNDPEPNLDDNVDAAKNTCLEAHENFHKNNHEPGCPGGAGPVAAAAGVPLTLSQRECEASAVEIQCLVDSMAACANSSNPECEPDFELTICNMIQQRNDAHTCGFDPAQFGINCDLFF